MKVRTLLFFILSLTMLEACGDSKSSEKAGKNSPEVVKQTRADGTLKSITQIDENDFAHGIKINYYDDGKTVRSKSTWVHGSKNGPAVIYYKNGQIFEHGAFQEGVRHGLSKKFHKGGELLSTCHFANGKALPGLVEYDESGNVLTYPEVRLSKIDKLAFENKVIIVIDCQVSNRKVEMFRSYENDAAGLRAPLEVKKGVARDEFSVRQGDVVMKSMKYIVELNTDYGNTLVREIPYKLAAKNR